MFGKLMGALVGIAILGSAGVANASLIGQDYRFQCTNCGPATDDTQTAILGSFELSLFGQFTVDVEESTLRIDWIFNSSGIIPNINFLWSELTWGVPGIIDMAVVDPSSTWSDNFIISFTGSSVSFTNVDDRTVDIGDFLLINLTTTHEVPEPSTLSLFGIILVGLGFIMRRSGLGFMRQRRRVV